ncbi:GreA/GreB family elongation factor [Verrucomicrobium spinosum]|uniref:GreA/GreB family elongation factor n=1 Tax=Verrucomicrobium spinosum TaxID=2736 RepID=UPI0001746B72|nr:GreA/GreB family elongation factor [Verrucomicrobium spinosum]
MKSSSHFAISQSDLHTLRTFLDHDDAFNPLDARERSLLIERLQDAKVFEDESDDEPSVAGLQTLVRVEDLSTSPPDQFDFTLVLPHEANFEDDQISILSPLGAAVFGRSAGTQVVMDSPTGTRRLLVLAVFRKAAIH